MAIKDIFIKNKKRYSSQKVINRRKLTRQNLIFLVVAVIIIAILVWVIISSLSFLAKKINESVRLNEGEIMQVEVFNAEGFRAIKNKISAPLVAPVSTTTPD